MGRAFALRDRGQLDEALAVCQEAFGIARSSERQGPLVFGSLVSSALTIDELASRLGRPALAREPLAVALRALERINRDETLHRSEELRRVEARVRARVQDLTSAS